MDETVDRHFSLKGGLRSGDFILYYIVYKPYSLQFKGMPVHFPSYRGAYIRERPLIGENTVLYTVPLVSQETFSGFVQEIVYY